MVYKIGVRTRAPRVSEDAYLTKFKAMRSDFFREVLVELHKFHKG